MCRVGIHANRACVTWARIENDQPAPSMRVVISIDCGVRSWAAIIARNGAEWMNCERARKWLAAYSVFAGDVTALHSQTSASSHLRAA